MSTSSGSDALEAALGSIPAKFRSRLVKSYIGVRAAYSEGKHDACGLRGGVFAEEVLRFLQEHLTGTHIPFGQKIPNFADETAKLEKLPKTAGPESVRVVLPRGLTYIYTLRNKRGVGHAAGEVDANAIDAATIARVVDWSVCELIRLFSSVSMEDAQELVDAIAVRQIPTVWSVVGRRRVLETGLDFKAQTLLLLYAEPSGMAASEDLFAWTEYSRLSDYRSKVLRPLHSARLIEYDRDSEVAVISPTGIARVEATILPALKASARD